MNVDGAENIQSSDDEDWERVIPGSFINALAVQPVVGAHVNEWFIERAKFIPLRLTLPERKFLRLVEAALTVSEYTDKIDTIGFGLSKAKRIVHQIRELCAIMSVMENHILKQCNLDLDTFTPSVGHADHRQIIY
jgi:hypothetical protein